MYTCLLFLYPSFFLYHLCGGSLRKYTTQAPHKPKHMDTQHTYKLSFRYISTEGRDFPLQAKITDPPQAHHGPASNTPRIHKAQDTKCTQHYSTFSSICFRARSTASSSSPTVCLLTALFSSFVRVSTRESAAAAALFLASDSCLFCEFLDFVES